MPTLTRSPDRLRAPALAAACGGAGLVADVAFDPSHTHVPLCPFRAVTGWWCPLCGGLRSVDALVHLQWQAALQDNLLLVLALPVVLVLWAEWVMRARAGRPGRAFPKPALVALVTVMVVFTLVRNLPFASGIRPI